MNAVQKLRQLVGEVRKGPASAAQAWPLAERLLSRLPVDQAEARRVCAERDADGFDAMIARLENPSAGVAGTAPPDGPGIPDETLKSAMRAFTKRLKLARLADESRLGNRYTTGGRKSSIDAIIPPEEFPPEVWKALARAGKLRDTGGGFYAPVE
ncbi:MAG TPA: hypothetical protein PLU35_06875 [Phycisphaerales bacterium]|nr:hypothetical protein [Phycisphaerales bacterium]